MKSSVGEAKITYRELVKEKKLNMNHNHIIELKVWGTVWCSILMGRNRQKEKNILLLLPVNRERKI